MNSPLVVYLIISILILCVYCNSTKTCDPFEITSLQKLESSLSVHPVELEVPTLNSSNQRKDGAPTPSAGRSAFIN